MLCWWFLLLINNRMDYFKEMKGASLVKLGYYLKYKTVYFITGFMIVICLVSLVFATKYTTVAYYRQDQEIGAQNKGENKASSKLPAISKIIETRLYANGKEVNGLYSYTAAKGEILMPIEEIVKVVGGVTNFYSPDSILDGKIGEKEFTIKIGEDKFVLNGKTIDLPYGSVFANDRILVPPQVLFFMDGFTVAPSNTKNNVFINYSSTSNEMKDKLIVGGSKDNWSGIYSVKGQRTYFSSLGRLEPDTGIELSETSDTFLISKFNKSYILNANTDFVAKDTGLNELARFTSDGKALYTITDNTVEIYDIAKESKHTFEDLLSLSADTLGYEYFNLGTRKVKSFGQYGSVKFITASNTHGGRDFTLVYKNGHPIIKGYVEVSPNLRRMVYDDGKNNFYISAYDGTGSMKIGKANNAKWISNTKVLLYTDDGQAIFDLKWFNRQIPDAEWYSLGQTLDGSFIYCDGKTIITENNIEQRKVFQTDERFSFATAKDYKGRMILASESKDLIYQYKDKVLTPILKLSDVLKPVKAFGTKYLDRSISFSQYNDAYAIATVQDKTTVINVFMEDNKEQKIIIDLDPKSVMAEESFNLEFIDKDNILVKSKNKVWIINYNNEQVQRYEADLESCAGIIYTP